MVIEVLLFVLLTGVPGEAAFLAGTGYLVSSEPVRGFIISSGWSSLISSSAHHMYESSGFDQIGYLTSGGRKGQHPSFHIAEKVLPKRTGDGRGQLPISHTAEKVLYKRSSAEQNNRPNCFLRLLCEVGADPTRFGVLGFKLNRLLRSQPEDFSKEAFFSGLERGLPACTSRYGDCSGGLPGALSYLWFYGL